MWLSRVKPSLQRAQFQKNLRCFCLDSSKISKSYWKPEIQIQPQEFEILLKPLLGNRYAIELAIKNNRHVVLLLNKNKPEDNQSNRYDQEKAAIFDLLNDWGVAHMVHRRLVKQLILYVDDASIPLPLEIDTTVEKISEDNIENHVF